MLLCKFLHMPTNLAIDDNLLVKALKVSGLKTKKDTVNQALKEFVLKREQKKILDFFGAVDYYDDYDPKADRRKS
jgi:Arc/MetJ family transcription regulator